MGDLVGGGSLSWRMVVRFSWNLGFYVKGNGPIDFSAAVLVGVLSVGRSKIF